MTTLQNFGIAMGDGTGRGGILQPKTKYKFRVVVSNFGVPGSTIAFTQQVMKVNRPSATFAPVEVHSYNSRAYYAGKPEWAETDLTLRDDVTNAVAALVGAQLQKQMNYFQQTTPLSGGNYKFQMIIDTLDGGDDTTLEEWVYEGCFLSSVGYDDFDYGSSDPMTIILKIRYDNVTQSGGLMPLTPILTSSNGGMQF